MKQMKALALFAIANFALAGTSFAQSDGVRATVPFNFTVGGASLPAGTYTISRNSPSIIVIRSHDKPIATMSLVTQTDHKAQGGGKLVFHRYGGQYFLSEVLCDQENMNLEVPTSKAEKRVQLQQAKLNSSSSETLVATR